MFTSGFKKDITIFSIYIFILKVKCIHVYKTQTVGDDHCPRKQTQCQLCTEYGAKLKLKTFKGCIYHFHYKWSVLAEPMKHRPTEPERRPIITDLWHCQAIDNH